MDTPTSILAYYCGWPAMLKTSWLNENPGVDYWTDKESEKLGEGEEKGENDLDFANKHRTMHK
ncbi:hypothetical protein PVK06_020484 [Gossypium arboreum]|uniref:Uncharacterized protein n=1 Tax=Gossypium arboreum TaxID=29729 RepID=A0ABR0PMP2_GOSAR|nr:hypothetical protein PVK06_020484 [Gossypium arboreum]